jgi:hypothetical protein
VRTPFLFSRRQLVCGQRWKARASSTYEDSRPQ